MEYSSSDPPAIGLLILLQQWTILYQVYSFIVHYAQEVQTHHIFNAYLKTGSYMIGLT